MHQFVKVLETLVGKARSHQLKTEGLKCEGSKYSNIKPLKKEGKIEQRVQAVTGCHPVILKANSG